MKKLISNEIFSVCGGAYLVATSRIQYEGLPEGCLASYVNEHQSDIATLEVLEKHLITKIMRHCHPEGYSFKCDSEEDIIALGICLNNQDPEKTSGS